MGLQLYRRHHKGCEAKRPKDSTTGKFEEIRRKWKRCGCQIYASGSLRQETSANESGTGIP